MNRNDKYNQRFTYNRTWEQIEEMLIKAINKQQEHYLAISKTDKKKRMSHMRNYKALEGVVKSLKWVLGDKDVEHPLE